MSDIEKKHVLIVDDEQVNIFMLEGVLSNEGFKVTTASDGFECLEILRSVRDIDVILLDIMMPEMSGTEVLERLKDNGLFSNIPVIMVSALTDAEHIQEALSLGAVEYIKKPVDEVELLARLRTVLKLKEHQEKLKESVRLKDDFIRMMSNELVTTFSSISGFAGELQSDSKLISRLDNKQQSALQNINKTSDLLIDYFNKMLAWSNLGQRQLILDKEHLSIVDFLKNIEQIFSSKIKAKSITFIIELYDLTINVDKMYFQTAICNLISNAIKFTPVKGTIKIYSDVVDDVRVLSIQDSGDGVSYDKKYILSSQYIKSTPDADGQTGNGTGIYVCRTILSAHGFWLDYISEPGQGTTFRVFMKNYNI